MQLIECDVHDVAASAELAMTKARWQVGMVALSKVTRSTVARSNQGMQARAHLEMGPKQTSQPTICQLDGLLDLPRRLKESVTVS